MSTTNENILKSLAVLEKNLKDINSAKGQVNKVVETSGSLANVIKLYSQSFESLSINVKAVIEDSRKFNLDSIVKLSEQTQNFSKEIAKLTDFDVTKSLKSIESEAIKQFQLNLSTPLEGLDKQVKNIEKEVAKLTEFDFQDSFSKIEKEVVTQFNLDIKEQLATLDKRAVDLQSKIDDFKTQILRIEKIDFESHFNEILTSLNNRSDKRHTELIEKHEKLIILGDTVISRFDRQDKELKILRIILFFTIGILTIGVVLSTIF